jgi:hypothetical protein
MSVCPATGSNGKIMSVVSTSGSKGKDTWE